MKICPKCLLEFDSHTKFCSRKCANSKVRSTETKKKISDSMSKFYSSDKGFQRKNDQSLEQKCRVHSEETKLKISKSVKASVTDESREARRQMMIGSKASPEKRAKLSRIAKDRGFGGHTSKRQIYYQLKSGEVIYLQSSYEIRFAEILDRLGIDWARPEPLQWFDENGGDHKYYPDFKVSDIYIDTKNDYLAVKDLPKIEAVRTQNNIDLRIVTNDQINEEYIGSLV